MDSPARHLGSHRKRARSLAPAGEDWRRRGWLAGRRSFRRLGDVDGRTLAVENLAFGPFKTRATLAFPAGADVLLLAVRTIDANGTANLESHGRNVTGNLTWWEQGAALGARFDGHGWLPAEAALQADAWQVPGAQLKLGGLYATVRGHGKIEWRDGHFAVEMVANGEPVAGKSAPPLEATLRGHGDSQTFTLDALHATLPGISVRLSEPVTINRRGEFRQGTARFSVQVDLAKQPWFAATGTAGGEARLVAGVAHPPVIDFNLAAQDLAVGDVALSAASAEGQFAWPRVEIAAGMIKTVDSKITGRGGWDFHTKEIFDATVAGQIRRATLARWLPAQPSFDAISITAKASGPLANLTHAGNASSRRRDGARTESARAGDHMARAE